MLPRTLLLLLLLPAPRVRFPLPDHDPADFLHYGCEIGNTLDGTRWPAWFYVDIRGLDPDKAADSACARRHSWCDLHSIYDNRAKAMKDCDRWMGQIKKLLNKRHRK